MKNDSSGLPPDVQLTLNTELLTLPFLTLKARSKEVIISGGPNINPREVEEALLLHPAVTGVAVIGEPDPVGGGGGGLRGGKGRSVRDAGIGIGSGMPW